MHSILVRTIYVHNGPGLTSEHLVVVVSNDHHFPIHLCPGQCIGSANHYVLDIVSGSAKYESDIDAMNERHTDDAIIAHNSLRTQTPRMESAVPLDSRGVFMVQSSSLSSNQLCFSAIASDTSHSFDVNPKLIPSELVMILDVLTSNVQAFAKKSENSATIAHDVTHTIRTGDASPIKQAPYRASPLNHEYIKNEVESLIRRGLVEQSSSPWSSPVILVSKEDGLKRLSVDYRKLNQCVI